MRRKPSDFGIEQTICIIRWQTANSLFAQTVHKVLCHIIHNPL